MGRLDQRCWIRRRSASSGGACGAHASLDQSDLRRHLLPVVLVPTGSSVSEGWPGTRWSTVARAPRRRGRGRPPPSPCPPSSHRPYGSRSRAAIGRCAPTCPASRQQVREQRHGWVLLAQMGPGGLCGLTAFHPGFFFQGFGHYCTAGGMWAARAAC